MFLVDPEVAVDREDATLVVQFGHAHQTSVGKRHGEIAVGAHQLVDAPGVVGVGEGDLELIGLGDLDETTAPTCRILE